MDVAPEEPRVTTAAPPAGPVPLRGWRRLGPYLKIFARLLLRRLKEDALLQQAGALAYNTLFSLLPILVLALLVLSIMSGPASAPPVAINTTQFGTAPAASAPATSAPAGLAPAAPAAPAVATSGPTPATAPTEVVTVVEPTLAERAQEWLLTQLGLHGLTIEDSRHAGRQLSVESFLQQRIAKIRELVQSPGTGIIAFAALLYGVLSLMMVIEQTFNAIYRSPQGRKWSHRFALYTALFFWGPLCIGTSIILSQSLLTAIKLGGWVQGPLSVLGSYAVSWILLVLFYKLIPNTVVRWRSAAIGAAAGAFLWEIGKYAFGLYVHYSIGTRSWYGNIALVPLFMFWIYLTWNFVLGGLQIAYVHQFFTALRRQMRFADICAFPIADLRWVLPLGVLLYRHFEQSHALQTDHAAEEIGIPPDVAGELLNALCNAGIVHRIDDNEGFVLARPAEKVTAEDLINAARALCTPVVETGSGVANAQGLKEFERLETEWLRSQTLPMLAGEK